MKPFSDNGRLTESQKTFNYRLSRCRMVVENSFGRLKGRWRCLLKRNDMALKHLPNCIASCVVLHNMCEGHGEQFENAWLPPHTNISREEEQAVVSSESSGCASAETIRSTLMEYCLHTLFHKLCLL